MGWNFLRSIFKPEIKLKPFSLNVSKKNAKYRQNRPSLQLTVCQIEATIQLELLRAQEADPLSRNDFFAWFNPTTSTVSLIIWCRNYSQSVEMSYRTRKAGGPLYLIGIATCWWGHLKNVKCFWASKNPKSTLVSWTSGDNILMHETDSNLPL